MEVDWSSCDRAACEFLCTYMHVQAGSGGQPRKEDGSENECLCVSYKALPSVCVLMCMNMSVSQLVAFSVFNLYCYYILLFCICMSVELLAATGHVRMHSCVYVCVYA